MKRFIFILFFILTSVSVISHRASASELIIEGNGEGSVNDMAISANQQTTVDQSNAAAYNNKVSIEANTGENDISENTGSSDVQVKTGDATVSQTLENGGNSSAYQSTCCNDFPLSIDIQNNGSDSLNTVSYELASQITSSTQNMLSIQNSIEGTAITGRNTVSGNVGNGRVETGNITAHELLDNSQNNPIAIKGSRSVNGASIVISGNGSGSSNIVSASFESADSFLITNETNITNDSNWNLVTGDNFILHNVGNVDVETGDIVFDAIIRNGPVNVSKITTGCCKDSNGPQGPDVPDGQGGLSDPGLPVGTIPPSATIASNTSSQDTGKDEEKNSSIASGNVLPATGGWLYLAIACNILSLLMGVFLRLRSGRSPNAYSCTLAS